MLSESLFLLSFNELKDYILLDLTILDIASPYVLVYVAYKVLGRYIYFRPQEHASKINRTFLALSLLTISLHSLHFATNTFPVLAEYRWIYALIGLTLLFALLSILMHWVVWKYHNGHPSLRYWEFMPMQTDYFKTAVGKSQKDGNTISSWHEEGVKTTKQNLHSDALLDVIALLYFLVLTLQWCLESTASYGWHSGVFLAIMSLWVAAVFLDRAVFSWIEYSEKEVRRWVQNNKSKKK